MGQPVIEVEGLAKDFDGVRAVDGISFAVAPGETVALLGGNGAGKTTTISVLLGLLVPSAGRALVLGAEMPRQRDRVLARLNFSSPYVDLPRRLTVEQNLVFFALLYGLTEARRRVHALAEALDFADLLKRPSGQLSAGQKTRVSLAKALVNDPELLLLDEPTASLDPDTGDWVRGYLEAYRARRGAAMLIASHNMAEVERLCDRVLMIRGGRIVDQGTPRALLDSYGRASLEEVFLDISRERRGRAEAGTAAQ